MATVLVVEDNDDVREMMAVALELGGGHVARTAANGLEALARLHEGPRPAVILADLMMPMMSGWELRAVLREDPEFREIPFVIVSAVMMEGIEAVGRARSLSKPVDIDAMLRLVDDVTAEHGELSGPGSLP